MHIHNGGRAIIISAFPGTGKTFYTTRHNIKEANPSMAVKIMSELYRIMDSDSSKFHWVYDNNGFNTKATNSRFPDNYIDYIKSNIGDNDIIFISSHSNVRDALKEAGIMYYLLMPIKDDKNKWMDVYKERGNTNKFISNINNHWDSYIDEMREETWPIKVFVKPNNMEETMKGIIENHSKLVREKYSELMGYKNE